MGSSSRSGSRVLPSLSRATPSAVSERCPELIGCPISRSLPASCVCLELRPLPSPGVTRLQRCRVGGGALSCLRANLRPPLKLDVQFSRIQLSWMGLRSLKRRYQRDEADQLELLAPQPFRRIVLPACVPPSLRVVGPEPSHNPAIQLMEEFSDMRAAKVSAIPSFFRGPKCNWRLALRCDDSRMTSPEARVRGSELSRKRSRHAQCGTLGPSVRPL